MIRAYSPSERIDKQSRVCMNFQLLSVRCYETGKEDISQSNAVLPNAVLDERTLVSKLRRTHNQ